MTKNINQGIEREFEIQVFDKVYDERTDKDILQVVHYDHPVTIKAKSKDELNEKMSVFKMSGQVAKIVREITSPQIIKQIIENENKCNNLSNNNDNINNDKITEEKKDIKLKNEVIIKSKPRYFKVGDIQVKEDNGVMYQKQWMRLTESESSNIRIINDKNNSTVNLNGKHIEMLKWIKIEDNNQDELCLEDEL